METRQAILLAAARVFERRGFAAARIEEILTEGGLTKGALYFHFDSKEALASAILSTQAEWSDHEVPEDGLAVQVLIDLSHRYTRAFLNDPITAAAVRLTLERVTPTGPVSQPYAHWTAIARDLLEEAQRRGELRPGTDPETVAWLLVATATGVQVLAEAHATLDQLPRRLDDVWGALLPGLVTPAVLTRLIWRDGELATRAAADPGRA